MNKILKYIFHASAISLIIISLWPGSLVGYLLYDDLGKQPDMIPNPIGTSINHTLAFFYLTTIGLISHINQTSFNKILIFLVTLSLFLELSHLFIPNRSFESLDLFANLLGTFLAIVIIFLYKKFKYGKI